MTFTALTAPASGRKPRHHDIIHVDLKSREDHIAIIWHLINLSALLPLLANLVLWGVSEFQELCRPNSSQVIKSYWYGDAGWRIKHLRRIYKILKNCLIPNTEKLVCVEKNSVVLKSCGITDEPCNDRELWQCLTCILDTLIVLHSIPLYHCDICWPNVICNRDNKSNGS